MSELPCTPAELRAQARQIRESAQYAQGKTRTDELAEAQALERRADELERPNEL
ncbi:MAG: hypothetical protein ACXWT0_08900 [Methylobacter sp.]|jgi:hypothetical protein